MGKQCSSQASVIQKHVYVGAGLLIHAWCDRESMYTESFCVRDFKL